jgi:hypothetical protein
VPQPRVPSNLAPEILEELDAAQAAFQAAVVAEREAGRRRAAAVLRATAAGLSRRQVGDRLGVTRGRVQQIIDAGR